MTDLELEPLAALADAYFGNDDGKVPRVAFLLVATPIDGRVIGRTSIISNITDTAALLQILGELEDAMRLKGAAAEGRA